MSVKIEYGMSYCERKGLSTSDLTEAQQTLYYIAENMRMDEKISKDGYEDFQKAIEALEQQPCNDAISREAVIEQFTHWYNDLLLSHKEEISFIDILKTLPPVTPQPTRWIPCSERLPAENDTYEVTLRGISELEGTTEIAYATWLNNDWLYHDVDDWQYKEVIAWKTRTQPYKTE